jgi:enoyl-CoA hydratase/carnithine racemase
MKKHVHYTLNDEIAVITMNSPPVNAFTDPLIRDFQQVLDELGNQNVRAMIITGTGRFFQAGGDMNRFLEIKSLEGARDFVLLAQNFMNDVAAIPCPVIAALNGYALGGGLEIALSCDIRIASSSARLGLPEVRYGILSGAGGTQRLSRLIGTGRAKLMMYTGEQVSAEKAYEIGLVDMVVEPEQLMAEAEQVARKIAKNSTVAVRHVKKCVDEGIEKPLDEGLAIEREYWAELIPYGDYIEGVNAFLEKRDPVFSFK